MKRYADYTYPFWREHWNKATAVMDWQPISETTAVYLATPLPTAADLQEARQELLDLFEGNIACAVTVASARIKRAGSARRHNYPVVSLSFSTMDDYYRFMRLPHTTRDYSLADMSLAISAPVPVF